MQRQIRRILAATDFSEASRLALRRAVLLTGQSPGSELTLVHAIEHGLMRQLDSIRFASNARRALEALARELTAERAGAVSAQVLEGSVIRTLPDLARRHDLLVLGASGSHRIREFALGTTAHRILYRTRTPTLVVRRAAEQPYRRVLVAADFSRPSLRAARLASDLARDADFVAVHVYQAPYELSMAYADVSDAVIHEYRARARSAAEVAMRRFVRESSLPAGRSTTRLEPGYPPRVLAGLTVDADLLVLGRQGRSRLGGALFGSVTEHLVAEAACDVLVVQ